MNYHKLIRELFYSTIQCNRSLAFELAKSTQSHAIMVEEFYSSLLEIPSFIPIINAYDPTITNAILTEVLTDEIEIKQQCIEQFCALYFHKKMNLNGYYLSGNKGVALQTFPAILLQCSFLEELDLSHNNLQQLPKHIGNLYNLRQLNLSSNSALDSLPDSLKELKRLEILNISGIPNLFRSKTTTTGQEYIFPDCLRPLTQLRHLNLQDVRIDALPIWIDEWKELESLHLFSGHSGHRYPSLHLPKQFLQLQQLKTLTIDAFSIAIPATIHQLTSLECLVVNQATAIPASLAQLQQLKYLDLSYLSLQFPLQHPSYQTLQELPKEDTTSRLALFGWEWLLEMTQLEEFIYKHAAPYRFTPKDIAVLKEALPHCTFSFE